MHEPNVHETSGERSLGGGGGGEEAGWQKTRGEQKTRGQKC